MRAGTETYTKRQQQTEVPLHPHIPYLPFWNSTFVLVLLLQGLLSPQTSTHPPPPHTHTHPVCNFKPFNNRGSLPSTATGRTRNRAEVGSFELGLARTLPQTSKCLSLMRTCWGGGRPRSLAYPPQSQLLTILISPSWVGASCALLSRSILGPGAERQKHWDGDKVLFLLSSKS